VSISVICGRPGENAQILINNRIAHKFSEPFVSIESYFSTKSFDLVLFETDAGGSGTVPGRVGLVIKSGDAFKFLSDDLSSGDGKVSAKIRKDAIELDFGIVAGRNKTALIRYDFVSLGYLKREPSEGLPKKQCKLMFEALPECVAQTPECGDTLSSLAMAVQRPINMMFYDYPDISREQVSRLCDQACLSKRVNVTFGEFSRSVCHMPDVQP
jgi:hypothetical protein